MIGDRDDESLEIELKTVDETGKYPCTQINLCVDGALFYDGLPVDVRWDEGPVETLGLHTSERFVHCGEIRRFVGGGGHDGASGQFLKGLRKSKALRIRVATKCGDLVGEDIFTFNVAGLIWEHPP
jgi:hypothetical protein